jgi:hypothetical protein
MICKKAHATKGLGDLPKSQAGAGRHKCAACAYEWGYKLGLTLANKLSVNLEDLPESQAGEGRHKSPHAAFALGYYQGVIDQYK